MKILLIYFLLFTFWAETAIGFRLTQVKGLSLMNVSIYLLLIVWAFTVARKRKLFEHNNVNIYLILMIFVVLTSIPVKMLLGEIPKINIGNEIISSKNWTNPFIIFFIMFNIVDDEKTCKHAMLGLILLLIATVLPMLLHTFGIMKFVMIRDVQQGRSAGFAEANQFATYVVLFIPLLLSFFMFQKHLVIKAISGLFLIMTLAGLMITGSRGGVASLLFAMIVYFFILGRQEKLSSGALMVMVVGVVVIGVISYMLLPSKYHEMVKGRFDPKKVESVQEYTSGRTTLLSNGLILFMERPLFGHGQYTFVTLSKKRFPVHGNSHNDYLLHLVHYGIIGLTVFIMIFCKLFRQVWNQLQSSKDAWKRKLYLSYLAGFFGYAFSMLGVNVITPRWVFWFYTAIIYKYGHLEINQQK